MTQSHEELDQSAIFDAHMPVGSLAMAGIQHEKDDQDSDLEASNGMTNQERLVAGMYDPEAESGFYWSPNDDSEEEDDDDPLAGAVEPTGGYDETEHVDLRAEEVNEDQYGNAVDGYGNLIYPDDEVLGPDSQEKEYTGNKLALLLTKSIKDKMSELGKSEADYLATSKATLVLKDAEGFPAYNLTVRLTHPRIVAGYNFDGAEGFYLAPEGIDKDQYGRDRKYVDGHFGWDYRNDRQAGGGFSCTYAGVDPHKYAEAILTEDALAKAELKDDSVTNPEEDLNR